MDDEGRWLCKIIGAASIFTKQVRRGVLWAYDENRRGVFWAYKENRMAQLRFSPATTHDTEESYYGYGSRVAPAKAESYYGYGARAAPTKPLQVDVRETGEGLVVTARPQGTNGHDAPVRVGINGLPVAASMAGGMATWAPPTCQIATDPSGVMSVQLPTSGMGADKATVAVVDGPLTVTIPRPSTPTSYYASSAPTSYYPSFDSFPPSHHIIH